MMKKADLKHFPILIILLLLPLLFDNNQLYGQSSTSRHFKVTELTAGVYAVIHKPGGYAICNSGIIDLGQEILIFDTFLSPEAAEDLLKIAQDLTGNPLKYVVNSHYHNDHVRGNQVLKPQAIIISTERIREQIEENEPKEIANEKVYAPEQLASLKQEFSQESDSVKREGMLMWIGYYEAMVRSHQILVTTLPDVTFTNRLHIHGETREVELIAFENGHTSSDVVLYLPKDKILFTADLVFIETHPYLADGDPDGLIRNLRQLQSYSVERVVPGHGEVGSSQDIALMIEYIETLGKTVQNFIAEGKSESDLKSIEVPEPYTHWQFPNFYRVNLRFMYQRIKSLEK
jgi:cyclase